MNGQALIVQGDALALPLPDASVDLIVTSPPYFALRAYDAGPAQIGSEPTPAAYLEALWAATAEMARVLKPTGSMFVDLGDKYDSGTTSTRVNPGTVKNGQGQGWYQHTPRWTGGNPKSLMLLPERYRIGCVDHLGLIARAVIVWDKPNGLPESVRDRVRRSHEDWVHLTRQPRYYAAVDEVRESYSPASVSRYAYDFAAGPEGGTNGKSNGPLRSAREGTSTNPLGKLPGSVWTIASEPLRLPEWLGVDHYAAFPSEWPRRLILGWSPPGICLECDQGRWPVVESLRGQLTDPAKADDRLRAAGGKISGGTARSTLADVHGAPSATILGYACSCTPFTDHPGSGDWRENRQESAVPRRPGDFNNQPKTGPWREYHLDRWTPPPTRPAVVLDPFGGTGTVAMVARALGRIGVSLDLSAAYGRATRWRIHHDAGKAISRTNLERQGQLL